MKVAELEQESGVAKLKEVSEICGDKWNISLPKTRIHTLEELIEYCKIDLSIWEVERFVCNKWEVGMRPAAITEYVTTADNRRIPMWSREVGDPMVIPLFQIKAFLRRKKNIVDAKQEIKALKELAKKAPPRLSVNKNRQKDTGNMLEISPADHHFGKLAWAAETGHENYDTKIAAAVWSRALSALLQRTAAYQFDEIWLVVGNDLLNTDSANNMTTKGTAVSTDTRYQKTFAVVRNTAIATIEELRKVTKKVKVILVPGNHDQLSVWHLGDSLECFFYKCKDVEIDNTPCYYKYHQFGDVMLLFTHGDKGKRADYPLLMATEKSSMFGNTRFREAHTGHTHETKLDEKHGVRVRTLSSLSPPDAWHAENAYVGNLRASEAFVWNKQQGLIGTAIYCDDVNVPESEK